MSDTTEPLIVGFPTRADQIRVGDTIATEVHCFIVEEIAPVLDGVPTEIAEAGGWVNLMGDTGDHFYRRTHGSRQEYYAAPDEMIDVVRSVEGFLPLSKDPSHNHTVDGIIGYAVRETIRNGEVLRDKNGRVGFSRTVIEGAINYARALQAAERYRSQRGGYAVVDALYGCGCRGGQR